METAHFPNPFLRRRERVQLSTIYIPASFQLLLSQSVGEGIGKETVCGIIRIP